MKSSERRRGMLGVLLIIGLAVGLFSPHDSFAQKLPVFKLAEPKIQKEQPIRILSNLYKGNPPAMNARDKADALVQIAGKKEVELFKESGGIFMRDVELLWNPQVKPQLPSKDQARGIADKFLADNKLLPSSGPHYRVSFDGFSETALAEEVKGKVETRALDVQANYKVDVSVRGADGTTRSFPVVGGGGRFKVAIGDRGSVVGYYGVWRSISEIASTEEVLPREKAIEQFKKTAGEFKLSKTDAFLAYYSAPGYENQSYLAPVWVVKAEANIDGKIIPLRNTIIAATKYGPEQKKIIPPTARAKDAKPNQPSLDQDEKGGQSMFDRIIPPAYAHPAYEAGASWLYTESGLPGCKAVGNGFVNNLRAAGWQINFNWGGYGAFESDWNRNDDFWVDAADFVLYCGHANMNGWVLHKPDDTSLNYTEVGSIPGSPNDLYGQNDAEWIIIAACGPLQDSHFVNGGGNAFDRWRGIFDGLHILLGYGAVTYDNELEGSRVTELCLAGWPIIDAWFRTAWEIQPSTNGYPAPNGPNIYVVAMYAHMGDYATRNDHIWGKGYVAPDPIGSGQRRVLMWQRT